MDEKDIMTAMAERHSVRQYKDEPVPENVATALRAEIDRCNSESGLHMQIVLGNTGAFDNAIARYGKFSGVSNYVAVIGKKDKDLQEKAGYYGERVVLKAQQLGLNTCWVGLTYSKRKLVIEKEKGYKVVCVIALGYGANQGKAHTSKPASELGRTDCAAPEWFTKGVEAAMLAPTAMNQQKFLFELKDGKVAATKTGGPYSGVDIGIVKLHFEIGAGKENFQWAR